MKTKTKVALINALIAGGLVFAGAFVGGNISKTDIVAALGASAIIFLTKMKDYYATCEETKKKPVKLTKCLFEFI